MNRRPGESASERSAETSMGVLDAVSLAQRLCVMERTGGDVPSDFLGARGAFSFFSAGFRAGLAEAALLAALLPLAMGVSGGAVGAFGEREADFSARCLVFVFCLGPGVASAWAFGAVLARCRAGELSRKAVGCLAWGRAVAMAAGGAGAFLAFHALSLLSETESVRRFLGPAGEVFFADPDALRSAATAAGEPLRKSAFAHLVLCPLLGFFPFLSFRLFGRRRRRGAGGFGRIFPRRGIFRRRERPRGEEKTP